MIPEDDRAGRDSGSFRGCPDRLSNRTGDGPAFCSAVIFERALTGSVGHGKAAVGGGHGGGISGTSSREWHYSRVFTVVTMRIWATRGLVLASLAVVFVGAIPCSRPAAAAAFAARRLAPGAAPSHQSLSVPITGTAPRAGAYHRGRSQGIAPAAWATSRQTQTLRRPRPDVAPGQDHRGSRSPKAAVSPRCRSWRSARGSGGRRPVPSGPAAGSAASRRRTSA